MDSRSNLGAFVIFDFRNRRQTTSVFRHECGHLIAAKGLGFSTSEIILTSDHGGSGIDLVTSVPTLDDVARFIEARIKVLYAGAIAEALDGKRIQAEATKKFLKTNAGLILKEHELSGFPGGLTQPMWDALGAEGFLRRTQGAGEQAIAKAVFGYCDGMGVYTFVGETAGSIATTPRGSRRFYWDTVFCPNDFGGKTYAEISEDPKMGIKEKMKVSQSFKALRAFLELRAKRGEAELFS